MLHKRKHWLKDDRTGEHFSKRHVVFYQQNLQSHACIPQERRGRRWVTHPHVLWSPGLLRDAGSLTAHWSAHPARTGSAATYTDRDTFTNYHDLWSHVTLKIQLCHSFLYFPHYTTNNIYSRGNPSQETACKTAQKHSQQIETMLTVTSSVELQYDPIQLILVRKNILLVPLKEILDLIYPQKVCISTFSVVIYTLNHYY